MIEQETTTDSNGKEKSEDTNNIKKEAELDSAIIHQMEYYFGDANLMRDKFLRQQVKLDEGWVPFDILLRFNRLAKLSNDVEVICNAINKSKSGLVEVSEDNKKVRRNPEKPLPEMNEERRKELTARTVYAKGFPKDAIIDDILEFFKDYEEAENVIMRRYPDRETKKKLFKGSIFVTFKTKDQAEKFINTKGIKFGETELLIRWQDDYLKDKQEEYLTRKNKKDKNKETPNVEEKEKEEIVLPTGTVLHFSKAHNTTKREDINGALTPLGADIAYIDFNYGDTEGKVRLHKENQAKEVFEKMTDGKIKIGDSEVEFRVLEGDEEKEHLDKTICQLIKRRKDQKNYKHNNKGKNFKGKFHGQKRKHDNNDDGPPTKVKN